MQYTFTDKDSQMDALKEFLDACAKWRREYETEHEDAAQNYLECFLSEITASSVLAEKSKYTEDLRQVIEKHVARGIPKKQITDELVNLIKPESCGICCVENAVYQTCLGELEEQVSHIGGTFNEVETNCVFSALKDGLTPDELESVARSLDEAHWNIEGSCSDCIYINCEYDGWAFVVNPTELDDALAELESADAS